MKKSVSIFKVFTGAAISALLCALSGPSAAAQFEDAEARIPSMTARTATDLQCLTTTFPGEDRVAEMPDMSIEFEQGASSARSVLVTFSGEWPIPMGSRLPQGSQPAGAFIILEIDQQRVDLVSVQGGVLVHEGTASSVSNGTHGFTFVTVPIAPGLHTAKILWGNNLSVGTGTICIFHRSLVVQHR